MAAFEGLVAFMPAFGSLSRVAKAALRERFGGKPARFRLAVSSGFVIATVGALTIGSHQAGNAEDLFSAFGSFFTAPQAVAPQMVQQTPAVRQARQHVRRASYDSEARPRSRRTRSAETAADEGESSSRSSPMRLGRASMCVRLCDGFAFPVGAFHGEQDLASHEATCRSECPGARTALYVLPSGADSIADGFEARTGKPYSEKAPGFHYTTYLDQTCTCHPQEGNRISSLLHDFTLRRGDAVMTTAGFRVFHGGPHFPFRQADFVRLAASRDVRKTARAAFHAIERASVTSSHPAIAQRIAPKPAGDIAQKAPGTKALEHQASIAP